MLDNRIPAEEFAEQLYGAAAELLSFSCAPVFAVMLPIIRQDIEERFETATTPDLAPWPPRKPNPRDDGHPLLIDTGTLVAAAIGQGTGAMEQVGQRELMVGIDGQVIEYAATQNFGRDEIPPREFFGLDEQTIEELEDLLVNYVQQHIFGNDEAAAQSGFRDAA